jgi:carotenoid cleavage dioxygenase
MDIERLKRGGDAKDVRIFRAPNAMPGHVINAFDDAGGSTWTFRWHFPDKNGRFPPPGSFGTELTR